MDSTVATTAAGARQRRTTARKLGLLLVVTLALRVPLPDKPLQHDEFYNAFPYLVTSPLTRAPASVAAKGELPFDWARDWRRQLAVHPPTLSAFYFAWIRVFGDAPVSVHVPPLLAGCVGVGATYLLGAALAGPAAGMTAALALTVSLAHIEHSTQAVHAAFEAAVLALSLWLFARVLARGGRDDVVRLTLASVVGVLLFYHFIVFLAVQTLVLWHRRRALALGPGYFVLAAVAASAVAAVFALGFAWREYGYAYWMPGSLRSLGATVFSLPRYFIASRPLPPPALPTLDVAFLVLCGVLALACILALARAVLNYRRRVAGDLLRLCLAAVFMVPFCAYLAIGLVGVARFGEPRNFFYLLPVYFVLIADWLWSLTLARRLKVMLAAAVVLVLLAGGLNRGLPYWQALKRQAAAPTVGRASAVEASPSRSLRSPSAEALSTQS
jgi:hypothetical protein